MSSKLAIFYALGLKTLYRVGDFSGAKALDLAPGPGHFSICMQKFLRLGSVKGVDLSDPMVATANQNAATNGLGAKVRFTVGDITDLPIQNDGTYDLVTMTFAAHHLPDHAKLTAAISEMERQVSNHGVIMLMDLARLPSQQITEQFVALAGKDYKKQGLDFFYNDFHASMYAAWTTTEMETAIREASHRNWVQLTLHGLPTLQILFGLPANRHPEQLFCRNGAPWRSIGHILAPQLKPEWYLTQVLFALGNTHIIRTKSSKERALELSKMVASG